MLRVNRILCNILATALEFGSISSGIVQVKYSLLTTAVSVSSTGAGTFIQVPTNTFSVNITPTSASNRIMIIAYLNHSVTTASTDRIRVGLWRDSTQIALSTSLEGSQGSTISSSFSNDEDNEMNQSTAVWFDEPNTTSQINYNFKMTTNAGAATTMYLNRTATNNTSAGYSKGVSSITVIELANGVF